MIEKKWRDYEEVAQYLLNEFADNFGLERVEEAQKIIGLRSGRKIAIDGKGVKKDNTGYLLVECKRYPRDRVEAEKLEALAYRIMDAGADGGIVVSPLGLQAGAEKIADSEKIISVRIAEGSTVHSYVLSFLHQVMVGVTDEINLNHKIDVEIIQAMGHERGGLA